MATNIGTAFFNVTFNTAPARRELTALVSNVNRNFGLLGGLAIVGATTAIAGLVSATVKLGESALEASIDYEEAFAGVRKTVDDGTLSAEQASVVFGKLNQDLRDLALNIPLDLEDDISKIAELGGQLGIPAAQLTEFTRIIGEVGVTTNVAVEDAATSFARLANIMGLTSDDFRDLGDTLINLGNKLPAQEDEILRFANRIAAAGEIAGFTADEVLAVGAAFASVGVPSERGGTAVQRTWIKITQAVAEGGEILDLIAQVSGETSEQFQQHWQEDAAGAWTNFIEGLGAAGTDAFRILRDLGLNDQRVIQSLLSLASAGDLMRTTFALAENDLNALGIESGLRFATTGSQLKLLQNQIHDIGISIGNQMKPAFLDILETVNEWIATNPELIDQLGKGLTSALEEVGDLVETLLPVLEDTLVIMPELARQTASWLGSLTDLVKPLADVGAGIADWSSGLRENAETGGFWAQLWNGLWEGVTQSGFQSFQGTVNRFGTIFNDIATKLRTTDPEEMGGGEMFWRTIFPITSIPAALIEEYGNAYAGAVRDAQAQATDQILRGKNPIDAAAEQFILLDEVLKDIDPSFAIDVDSFNAVTEHLKLSKDQVADLIVLLNQAGIRLPLVLTTGSSGAAAGHPRGGRPAGREGPLDITAIEAAAELAEETLATNNELLRQDAFTALRDSAEKYAVSIDVVLDNYERLAPLAAAAMESTEEGFGEAQLRADLFAESMRTLRDNIDFVPATAGMFGIGPLTEQIQLAETTLASSGDKVKAHGADIQKNIIANLNTIAAFEANLIILAARGFDDLVRVLAEAGPEMAHAAEDFVSGARTDPGVLEAALEAGGTISDELQAKLDAALAAGEIPQGLMDLITSFGSDAVTSAVYNEAYASGQQYGEGFMDGIRDTLGFWAGFLGIGGPAPMFVPGTTRYNDLAAPPIQQSVYQYNYFNTLPTSNATSARMANSINQVRVNKAQ